MSYLPPAGAVGHVVAKLFGADPRSEIIVSFRQTWVVSLDSVYERATT
jgi:uncharacterized membrane protein